MGTKPNLLFVGPMKSGTSWIDDYLRHRADVCLPNKVKETFYFDRHHDRPIEWYLSLFNHYDPRAHRLVAEVAPSLFHVHEDTIKNIRDELGDIRIIVTLRDPVKRSWSHYLHMRRGYTKKTLVEAIKDYPEILQASFYRQGLENWSKYFSQVIAIHQELLSRNEQLFIQMINEYLDLPVCNSQQLIIENRNEATVPPSYLLARLGRYISRILRATGQYELVNFAKSLGLKKFFYGVSTIKNQSQLNLGESDEIYLRKLLEEEIEEYNKATMAFLNACSQKLPDAII